MYKYQNYYLELVNEEAKGWKERKCSDLSSPTKAKSACKKWALDRQQWQQNVVPKKELHRISEKHSQLHVTKREMECVQITGQRNFPCKLQLTLLTLPWKLHEEQGRITSHCKRTITNLIQASVCFFPPANRSVRSITGFFALKIITQSIRGYFLSDI